MLGKNMVLKVFICFSMCFCFISEAGVAAYRCFSTHNNFGEFVGYGPSEQSAYLDSYSSCQVFVPRKYSKGCSRSLKNCTEIKSYIVCHYYNTATDEYFSGKGNNEQQAAMMAKVLCQRETGEFGKHCHQSYIKLCIKEI